MTNRDRLGQRRAEAVPDGSGQLIKRGIFRRLWLRRRQGVLRKVLTKRGGRLLDLGCKDGYLTNYLAELNGGEVWGVDVSRPAIASARKKYPQLHFRLGDSQKRTPFVSGYFDYVTMFDSLGQLPDAPGAVKEAHRLLKPGGQFIVGVPIEKRFLFKLMWGPWEKVRRKHSNRIHNFSHKSFRRFMSRRKFRELKLWRSHGGGYLVAVYLKK